MPACRQHPESNGIPLHIKEHAAITTVADPMGTLDKPGTMARFGYLRLAFASSLPMWADTAHHVKVDEHRAAWTSGDSNPAAVLDAIEVTTPSSPEAHGGGCGTRIRLLSSLRTRWPLPAAPSPDLSVSRLFQTARTT